MWVLYGLSRLFCGECEMGGERCGRKRGERELEGDARALSSRRGRERVQIRFMNRGV